MKLHYLLLLLLNLFPWNPKQLFGQKGIIKGQVIDAINNEPIIGASVGIPALDMGTITDFEGAFEIKNLEPGLYTIAISFVGYKMTTKTEIQVTNSRPANITVKLIEDNESIGEVVVKAAPFKKTDESPLSLQTIGTAEIQRNPGGNRDISKVIRILPGVTTTNSFRNDLIIRGGAPNENRFYLDDVEVPNINHYATQGASGGPQGLINVDLIAEVDFFSGAFPANRGNTLSSIFRFTQKNARDDRLGFTASVGATDVSLALEGPLSKKNKSSFLFSARQSYLQFLFKAIGLPFLPTYNDFQFKVKTKFSKTDELYVTGLGALDRFQLNLDANETAEQRYLLDNIPINNQWNYTLGVVYKKFRPNGFMTFVLSRNMLNNDIFKYIDNDETKDKALDYNSQESENKFRYEHNLTVGELGKLSYGIDYQYVRYYNTSKIFAVVNGLASPILYETSFNFNRYGAFGQLSKTFLENRLTLSTGVRLDGSDYATTMANPFSQLSPRFSASFAITENFSINANTGLYYQLPAYTALGYTENDVLVNRDRLKYIQTLHIVGGIGYSFPTATKISIEGYYKKYNNYPFLLNEGIALANFGADFGVVGNAPVDASGEGQTYGLEFLVQQRQYKGFFGILAYTIGYAEFLDKNGKYVPSAWDSRHILNAALGKNFNIVNKAIQDAKNEKRLAKGKEPRGRKLVNQTLQIGVNLRLQTGLPYTPYNDSLSALTANWNVFGKGLRDYDRLNEARSNLFYGVDFRIDYKWFFDNWSLNLYLDLQNFIAQAAVVPELILDQGETGEDPIIIENIGQPNEAYRLREINNALSTTIPSIGIIIQY